MDTKTRAEKIAEKLITDYQIDSGCSSGCKIVGPDFKDFITSQLDEAQAEVLEQNEVFVRLRIDEAAADAVKKAFGEANQFIRKDYHDQAVEKAVREAVGYTVCNKHQSPCLMCIAVAKQEAGERGGRLGFVLARAQAAGICHSIAQQGMKEETWKAVSQIAERIRAMEPGLDK